ncbi:MAG: tRNA adenosine(34) deaminase TadA [Clostridiales bacterium]|nr:tRNA adenosine(34) deaminase TadA [Clostridiales bacterium]
MAMALEEARRAGALGEPPVGAVLVGPQGELLARAGNRREAWQDPTAHAEMLVIREGARKLRSWRLEGCTLYVTLEPCAMCAGAAVLARVDRVVFGAFDPKGGAAGSLLDVLRDPRLTHRPQVLGGVMEDACGEVLRSFFHERR